MPRRVQIKESTAGSYYTLAINPIGFEDQDSREFELHRTIDGHAFEFVPVFDGRPRTFTWKNIPNKEPYVTMISTLKSLMGYTCHLKLNYLEKTGDDDTSPITIRVLNVATSISDRAGPDSYTSNIIYDTIIMTYVHIL